ncbi:unnamed protein product [Blepharisma stoltei]|uniref:RanBP2-type domain-containing protein n=1 Tax=Blepharisma stoltei TaxID=1481888 RepID=A0AAU9IQE8_9CILI|nr:unnamed protein product [Blepharisma stoltei]
MVEKLGPIENLSFILNVNEEGPRSYSDFPRSIHELSQRVSRELGVSWNYLTVEFEDDGESLLWRPLKTEADFARAVDTMNGQGLYLKVTKKRNAPAMEPPQPKISHITTNLIQHAMKKTNWRCQRCGKLNLANENICNICSYSRN